ncbi:uncharacterized protein LOC143015381 [Genypterus blacodes]|uniref:uncharacterized protein LOC143015381 n=1 Tax=Genypterus blacodes TaxID=154954 RepID=UPI003F76B151
MSERRDAAARPTDLWRNASKHTHGTKNTAATSSPVWKELHSPKRRANRGYPALSNGDSPGDGEVSQDIIWDSTSPLQAKGKGHRNTRVVEISDIANRIAPKDAKPVGSESPLLQWIGDSAVPCTPDIPKPRNKKKSFRHNSVDDLLKLAKQFDQNMQQDKESSEQQKVTNSNVSEPATSSYSKQTETALPSTEKNLKCSISSSSDRVEAELHALFDSSTQAISGRLSQSSTASACSQDMIAQTQTLARPHQPEPKSGSAALKAPDSGSRGSSANACDDFDDDWENDDLVNDSFVLALTNSSTMHKTASESNGKMNTAQLTSVCKPAASRVPGPPVQPGSSALQQLCPKPKTTNRSTFKLEPNPHFQTKTTVRKEASKSMFSVQQSSKSHMSDQKSTTKTSSASTTSTPPQPDKPASQDRGVKLGVTATDSVEDTFSDCLWGDGEDDELLYQVCDVIEKLSNSQSLQASLSNSVEKQETVDKQPTSTAPVPIETARCINTGASTKRESSGTFVRSNSLPGSVCNPANYQGWNVPFTGGRSDSRLAQSLPGGHVNLGTFNQATNSPGTPDTRPHTVTAGPPQKSKPQHTAFKRNLSDSATTSNKVFVTSKMTVAKCSAAEIERKKQEALARRRLRMQNVPKP